MTVQIYNPKTPLVKRAKSQIGKYLCPICRQRAQTKEVSRQYFFSFFEKKVRLGILCAKKMLTLQCRICTYCFINGD